MRHEHLSLPRRRWKHRATAALKPRRQWGTQGRRQRLRHGGGGAHIVLPAGLRVVAVVLAVVRRLEPRRGLRQFSHGPR